MINKRFIYTLLRASGTELALGNGNHLAIVHHRTAAQGNHALGLALHGDFTTFVNQRDIRFGVDVGEEEAPYPNVLRYCIGVLPVFRLKKTPKRLGEEKLNASLICWTDLFSS